MARRIYTLEHHLKQSLKNPKFRKIWEESEVEYQLSHQLIAKRLAKKMSQKQLAKKAKTTQAVISRVENMNCSPTLKLLKKIATAFDAQLRIAFE